MQGIETYSKTQMRTESPRAAEHRRLAELTKALNNALQKPDDAKAYAIAVLENQSFWSRLKINVLNANTSMPAEMRAHFIELAGWVERQSLAATTGQASLDDLIAVNQQIMEGLRPYKGSIAEDTLTIAD